MFFPVYINLKGKRVVVVGGGEVAERKIDALAGSGAAIMVISPEVTQHLVSLAASNTIELHQRPYRAGDCAGATLVLSATDDPAVSRTVWEETNHAGILLNTADQPDLCDFIMPAIVRRGDLTIAISTGGASPALAATLRHKISSMLGPEYERLLQLLAGARAAIRNRIPDEAARKALHYRVVDSNILSLLQQNDTAAAEQRLKEIIEEFACQEKTP